MDTKIIAFEFNKSKIRPLFDRMLAIDAYSRKWGVALCWKAMADVQIKLYSLNHICLTIAIRMSIQLGTWLAFYGELIKENIEMEFLEITWTLVSA